MEGDDIKIRLLEVGTIRQKDGINQAAPKDLLASLAKDGQQREITVHPITDFPPYEYEIEDGGRRLACALELGWKTINARVVPFDLLLSNRRTLASNIASHNHIQEARALEALGGEQAEIAGYSKGQIKARLKLLKLNEHLRDMLDQDLLTEHAAKELAKLPIERQEEAWVEAQRLATEAKKPINSTKYIVIAARRIQGQIVNQQPIAFPNANVTVAPEQSNGDDAAVLVAGLRKFVVSHPDVAKQLEQAIETLDALT